MPATAADIAAATRESVTATWSDSAIRTRYPRARDASTDAPGGFCDAIADASTLVAARGALIGTERRRFAVVVDGVQWLDPSLGVPVVTLIDAEQSVSGNFLVARMQIDLENERTILELFG